MDTNGGGSLHNSETAKGVRLVVSMPVSQCEKSHEAKQSIEPEFHFYNTLNYKLNQVKTGKFMK